MKIRTIFLYIYFSKLDFMSRLRSGDAKENTIYSVSLSLILFLYIALIFVEDIYQIQILNNPILLFIFISIIIYMIKRIVRKDEIFSIVEKNYIVLPNNIKNKIKFVVYSVDLLSFVLLICALYFI